MPKPTLSILVPVYNEAQTLEEILDRVCRVELIRDVQKEIIIINDGSTDESEQRALGYVNKHPSYSIRYLSHDQNLGKGAAIQTGIRESTGDFLVIQDFF